MTTLLTPFGYAPTISTTSVQVLPPNPSRKAVIFFNPSTTATIAVCPSVTASGAALAAVINGAGSITIVAGGLLTLPQAGWPDSAGVGAAFNAIASGITPITVWEF
jgi:hypothetical protein